MGDAAAKHARKSAHAASDKSDKSEGKSGKHGGKKVASKSKDKHDKD